MKCDNCEEEKDLHLFYYGFFNNKYDENKWGFVCDDCRKLFLRYSSMYEPWIEKYKKPLTDMYEMIDLNVQIRREELEKKRMQELVSKNDLIDYKVDFESDFETSYSNIQTLSILILKRTELLCDEKEIDSMTEHAKMEVEATLLDTFTKEDPSTNHMALVKLNETLRKVLEKAKERENLIDQYRVNYELAHNYLHRSKMKKCETEAYEIPTINSLVNTVEPSPEHVIIKNEKAKELNEAILSLESFEIEFISLRNGFGCEKLTIEELQKKFYEGLSITQLLWIEEELITQIKENAGIIRTRRERTYYK